MKTRIVVGLLATLTGCGDRIGPLSRADSELALTHGGAAFDAAEWQHADASGRGAMLASLFRDRLPRPGRNTEVFAVLGAADCYLNYEDEPCYRVRLGDAAYRLEFPVNHSDRPGAVLAVRLRSAARGGTAASSPAP